MPHFEKDIPAPIHVDASQVLSTLKSFPRDTSPGASHLRPQHLRDAICGNLTPSSESCLMELTKFMNLLLSGRAHPYFARWLCGAPLLALIKPNDNGFRPIAVGETLRRLASKLCCLIVKSKLPDVLIPFGQVGVGIKGGLEAAIHMSRALLHEFGSLDDHCLLKVDFKNAFNECDRATFLHSIREHLPELFGWSQYCYTTSSELRFGTHQILSSAGVQQGDPLGPLLFALTLRELLNAYTPPKELKLQLWYLDDGTIVGPRASVRELYNHIIAKGHLYGLMLNPSKCEVFWPSGDPTFPNFPPEIFRPGDGITLLGSPLWGSADFISSQVEAVIDKVMEVQEKILELDDPQVEMHLLRSCLGVCRVNHLLRTVPKDNILNQLHKFDDALRSSLGRVIHSAIPDTAWQQASLPFRLGGMGIKSAVQSVDAAFVASCNATRLSLPATLLEDQGPLEMLPGEDTARSIINPLINTTTTTLNSPSQSDLQAGLDQYQFENLLDVSNIRDQVRLRTLAEENHTSAWLKAIPWESLGLSMSGPIFIVAVKIWLGMAMFSMNPSPRCACNNVIDPYGDHLVGCAHGPLRIARHNGLRDVIWHALLQDDSNTRREQRISGESQERPGDVAHPSFVDGRPTFFDISVTTTLRPGNLNRALVTAGVAAVETEMKKDAKYENHVRNHGGRFVPLVVESLGLWSTFATSVLHTIAERSTLKNGLTTAIAFANLMQQLSMVLWSFNAKMILNYFKVRPDPSWDLPC